MPSKTSGNFKPALSPNAVTVLEKRYLKRDLNGKPLEVPADLFRRVADAIAAADEVFDTKQPTAGVGAWLVDQGRQLVTPEFTDEWAVLNSPTRFGRYSAARLLATLPDR